MRPFFASGGLVQAKWVGAKLVWQGCPWRDNDLQPVIHTIRRRVHYVVIATDAPSVPNPIEKNGKSGRRLGSWSVLALSADSQAIC